MPDAVIALLAQTNLPGAADIAEGIKADQKPGVPALEKGLAQAEAQTQAHGQTPAGLMLAIAKIAGLSGAPEDKKPDPASAKASPGEPVPSDAQPDAEVPAPPKQADAPDDVETDVTIAMATVPAAVPVVPVPAPAPGITAAPSADSSETKQAVSSISADVKSAPAPDMALPVMAAQTAPVEAKPATKTDQVTDAGQPEADGEKPVAAADKTTTDEPAPETETVAPKPANSASPDGTQAKSTADAKAEKLPDDATDLPAKAPKLDSDTQKAPMPAADATANANANATANAPALPAPAMTHSVASHGVPQAVHQSSAADAVPIAGVAVEIAAHARDGKNHFEIRLDPPDLGRIDVRLHIDHDGQVTSHLRVDRAETLDLLRRDAPALEKALQDAGLKTSDSGLQFSLRHQNSSQHNQNHEAAPTSARLVLPDEASATAETRRHYGRLAGLGGGVDIRV